MNDALPIESTLTDRYQTTVPESVRRVLRLGKRDKIRYTVRPDGDVLLSRSTIPEDQDPALSAFLALLARDMAERPERVQGLSVDLMKRVQALVEGVEVDLDAPLSADDE
jgi:antitoxin PrlF